MAVAGDWVREQRIERALQIREKIYDVHSDSDEWFLCRARDIAQEEDT